jgi:hypothetical protein
MIETEEQRRWWFATHPEYSWSRRGIRGGSGRESDDKVDPEEVDAYVNEALKYETGPVADLLKSVKRNFGTEGNSSRPGQRLAFWGESQADREKSSSANENTEDRDPTFWDAVFKGINDTLQGQPPWFAIGGSSTRDLRRNMRKDGKIIPEGHAAHHIVPKNDGRFPEAGEARRILKNFGIDLDTSANGVALPYKPGIGQGGYHPAIHTGEYYRNVVKLLRSTATRDGVLKNLKTIENGLRNGKFPK